MSKKKIQALTTQLATHENFGQFRYLTTDDGEIWFVGVDIAKILGYKNGSRDVNRHVDPEDRKVFKSTETVVLKTVDSTGLKIPNRGLIFINESGLYSLIFGSQLPEAKKFTRWVTSEVLPSIRKFGYYKVEQSKEEIVEKTFSEAAKEGFFDELNEKYPNWELGISKVTFEKNENGEVCPVYHLNLIL